MGINNMYVSRPKVKYCSDESGDISQRYTAQWDNIYTSAKFNIYIKIHTNKVSLMVHHMTSG